MKSLILTLLFLTGLAAQARGPQCHEIFVLPTIPLGTAAPIEQLFLWEETANIPVMLKPTSPVAVPFSIVAADKVEAVHLKAGFDGTADEIEVFQFFEHGDKILWPKHPLNSDASTPFFNASVSSVKFMRYSASRSLFFYVGDDLYSLKVPTDHPHPYGNPEPSKSRLSDRAELAVHRSQAIKDRDARGSPSPYLQILYDAAAYLERETGNGIVVRDLRPLQDGNFYLPGFAVPFAGREILAHLRSDQSFQEFWAVHYAEAVGRAKAELLLRYGLQMNAPNAQNILVQLDKNFLPTGKIFFRDLSDSKYFENVALPLGAEDAVRRDIQSGVRPAALLNIKTEDSFWKMDQAGLDPRLLDTWEARHDAAFTNRIVHELGLAPGKYRDLDDLQGFFATDGARDILANYAASHSGI